MTKIANHDIVMDVKRAYSDPSVKLLCESHEILRSHIKSMLPMIEAVIAWHHVENEFLDGKKPWDDMSEACYRNMYAVVNDYVNHVPAKVELENVS